MGDAIADQRLCGRNSREYGYRSQAPSASVLRATTAAPTEVVALLRYRASAPFAQTFATESARSTTSGRRNVGCSGAFGSSCMQSLWRTGRSPRWSLGTPGGGVIRQLVASIYLSAPRGAEIQDCGDGDIRYALHFAKIRVPGLRVCHQGADFLRCHFHAVMFARFWEKQRTVHYCPQHWPSRRAMKRTWARTDWSWFELELPVANGLPNWHSRARDNYFQTESAFSEVSDVEKHVWQRLPCCWVKKRCHRQLAGQGVVRTTPRRCDQTYSTDAAGSAARKRRNDVRKGVGRPYTGTLLFQIEGVL